MSVIAVQSAKANAKTLAFGSNVASGNLLVVSYNENVFGTVTISDTIGTVYTRILGEAPSGNQGMLWYGIAPSSGSNTVTLTSSTGTFPVLFIAEFSGISGTLDTVTCWTTFTGFRGSTTTDGAMVFTFLGGNHASMTFNTPSTTTLLQTLSPGGGSDSGAIGYQVAATAGVQDIDLVNTDNRTDNTVIIVSFLPLGVTTSARAAMRQAKANDSGQGAVFRMPVVAGNLIVVAFGTNTAGTPTMSDTIGTTFTHLTKTSGSNIGHFWYGVAPSSGANTVTITGSWSWANTTIGEVTSVGAFDVSTTSAAASGYTITTALDHEALITAICANHINTYSAGTGCVIVARTFANDTGCLSYQNGGVAGSQTSGLTGASTDNAAFFLGFAVAPTSHTGTGGAGGGVTQAFRRTLSDIGTRMGSRQMVN